MSLDRVKIEVSNHVSVEGIFTSGKPGKGGGLILHPHPLYGGSMDNNVVLALASALARVGAASLRINFRGVGGSTGAHGNGVGEREDVLAASAWLHDREEGPFFLAGYSFGALVGSNAACGIADIAAGIWVAPPLILEDLAPWPQHAGPLLVLAGDRDEFIRWEALQTYMWGLGARGVLKSDSGGDHLWRGKESALINEVTEFMSQLDI